MQHCRVAMFGSNTGLVYDSECRAHETKSLLINMGYTETQSKLAVALETVHVP